MTSDQRPKLRFPSVGMKIPPPMQITPAAKPPTSVPIQPVSVSKSRIPVTPVVTLPGQEIKDVQTTSGRWSEPYFMHHASLCFGFTRPKHVHILALIFTVFVFSLFDLIETLNS